MHSRAIAFIFYAISNNFPNGRMVDNEGYKLMKQNFAKEFPLSHERVRGVNKLQ
jgi:hypothetical protein